MDPSGFESGGFESPDEDLVTSSTTQLDLGLKSPSSRALNKQAQQLRRMSSVRWHRRWAVFSHDEIAGALKDFNEDPTLVKFCSRHADKSFDTEAGIDVEKWVTAHNSLQPGVPKNLHTTQIVGANNLVTFVKEQAHRQIPVISQPDPANSLLTAFLSVINNVPDPYNVNHLRRHIIHHLLMNCEDIEPIIHNALVSLDMSIYEWGMCMLNTTCAMDNIALHVLRHMTDIPILLCVLKPARVMVTGGDCNCYYLSAQDYVKTPEEFSIVLCKNDTQYYLPCVYADTRTVIQNYAKTMMDHVVELDSLGAGMAQNADNFLLDTTRRNLLKVDMHQIGEIMRISNQILSRWVSGTGDRSSDEEGVQEDVDVDAQEDTPLDAPNKETVDAPTRDITHLSPVKRLPQRRKSASPKQLLPRSRTPTRLRSPVIRRRFGHFPLLGAPLGKKHVSVKRVHGKLGATIRKGVTASARKIVSQGRLVVKLPVSQKKLNTSTASTAPKGSSQKKVGQIRKQKTSAAPTMSSPKKVVRAVPKISSPKKVVPAVPKVSLPKKVVRAVPKVSSPKKVVRAVPKISSPKKVVPAVPKISSRKKRVPAVPKISSPKKVVPASTAPKVSSRKKVSKSKSEQSKPPQLPQPRTLAAPRFMGRSLYVCEHEGCKATFQRKNDYTDHLTRVHLGDEIKCTVCGKTFGATRSVKRHMLGAHPIKAIAAPPKIKAKSASVGKPKTKEDSETSDAPSDAPTGKRARQPKTKEGTASGDANSDASIETAHPSRPKRRAAAAAAKVLKELNEPEITSSSADSEPVPVRKSRRVKALSSSSDDNDETFTCTVCNRVFTTEEELKVHNKKVHGFYNYCDLCKQSFQNYSLYHKHIREAHIT